MHRLRFQLLLLPICLLGTGHAFAQEKPAVLRCIFKGSVELHSTLEPSSPVIARIDCGTSVILVDHRSSSPHVRTKDGKDGYIISFNGGQWSVQPQAEDALNDRSTAPPKPPTTDSRPTKPSEVSTSKSDVPQQPETIQQPVDERRPPPSAATSKPLIDAQRSTDDLTDIFKRLQTSIVTVWSEFGYGTGFIIERSGLILTNEHVVGSSIYIAVQSDARHKTPATLVAASREKDIAVLWTNLEALPGTTVAPLPETKGTAKAALEGERVLAIASPLNQRKVMTTGIVRKMESQTIISDINLNQDNSGGPLINSAGEVIGITSFANVETDGPSTSSIIRIEEAGPFIADARALISQLPSPPALSLPVDPMDPFPIDAFRRIGSTDKFDSKAYSVAISDFELLMITPVLKYRMQSEATREAEKTKGSRAVKPFENYRGWREYSAEYKPVLQIQISPETGDSLWGVFNRGLSKSGVVAPAKQRFKTNFVGMRLLCGRKEVAPIHPGKIAHLATQSSGSDSPKDVMYEGLYSYPADAISPACGQVTVEVYSEKNRERPTVKVLDNKVIERIAEDFAPYLKSR
jgi:S1-C subfamily serine protease